RRTVREVFATLWRDVSHVVRLRQGWTGMLLFSSPVGTAALLNYFAGMAADYHATAATVERVNGWFGAVVTAGGSLVGGYLCDRFSRRAMYMLSGGLTAVCALAMMAAPVSPATYAYGVTAYLFVTGLCYAGFSAVVLETIGKGGAAASTQYALFVSCGNLAINYVGFVDTRFDKGYGPRGLLGVDAAMNVFGVIALYFLFRWLGGFKKRAEAAA
ncbi:MAG: hypothetical protein LC659_05060, partial [Myxococcales bacterium]|nr:hypothetical protein [Myxococcales bacterium]